MRQRLPRATVLLLTTIGRCSGAQRTIPLIYGRSGEDHVRVVPRLGEKLKGALEAGIAAEPDVRTEPPPRGRPSPRAGDHFVATCAPARRPGDAGAARAATP